VELLAGGAGFVVGHRNPAEIAAALRLLVTRGDVAQRMSHVGAAAAPRLLWPAVAEQYRSLASALITASVAA
jgi:glycosyltransferase involved in cell wall biosynthesis